MPTTLRLVASTFAVCLALAACDAGDDPAGTTPTDSPVDEVREKGIVVREARLTTDAIAVAKIGMHAAVDEDPTLDLTASAMANTTAIAQRLQMETASCAMARVELTAGMPQVTVAFGRDCMLPSSMTTVSGTMVVTVAVDAGRITVSFSFIDLTVGARSVNGTAQLSTSDLRAYAITADLSLAGAGALTFDGTTLMSGMGATTAVTVTGTGTVQAGLVTEMAPGVDGFTCTNTTSAPIVVDALHRVLSSCWADAGSVKMTRNYTCTRMERRGIVTMRNARVETTARFSSATATSGTVALDVATTIDGVTTHTMSTQMLPGTCD